MKEIICYKLKDGSIFEDKQVALLKEQELNNKSVLDHRQLEKLKFKQGDTVYIASRSKIRQCKVININEHRVSYDENIDELYTSIDLEDINDFTNTFTFSTSELNRNLNKIIVTKFTYLCNFDYEKYL